MPIRTGILLLGAEPVNQGVNAAVRGFADIDGAEEPVVAKALSFPEILGEVYCSLLCKSLGLPVPEPLILRDQMTASWMFAFIDLPHPNCSQFLNLDQNDPTSVSRWSGLLSKWASLPSVIAFDEWINNRDRNPGNILWEDDGQFALIDHGKALGIDPTYDDRNKLVDFWLVSNGDELSQRRMRKAALNFAAAFDEAQALECEQETLLIDKALSTQFATFVCGRAKRISDLISGRFPHSQLTLDI